MSTHKHIDMICLAAVLSALVLCVVFMNGEALGIQAASEAMGYENRLFDTSKVHTIDIVIDNWDEFLSTAQSEEYSVCSVVIDGEAIKNVGIRGKGNTSLSTVASMDSDRYSFKIEFDQYDSTKTYHGLDKLSLNNTIQDNTYMKDYLSYQMMCAFDVPAPLCSYVWITVNGEDWGLYLAVEAVEESFLQRNYGSSCGELYKPDSMNMGGGRGNGRDFEKPDFSERQDNADNSNSITPDNTQGGRGSRGGMVPGNSADDNGISAAGNRQDQFGGGGSGGMGSSETKLQYIDDDPDSYSAIFDSAKTVITDVDKIRLISSLKQLSACENLSEVVNVDDVLRYFVVHNYVVNGDSYTGSMIHNYYLYEENGQLSMIPWDYNLAFGTFQSNNADSAVNDDIDAVLSDRPMQAWIFSHETYRQRYYGLYAELLEQVDIQGIIEHAYELIAPYVEKDPTAFCTYDEFRIGAETLKAFCALRSESVQLQLSGSTGAVDVGTLNLSAMGTMGGFDGRGNFDHGNRQNSSSAAAVFETDSAENPGTAAPGNTQNSKGSRIPGTARMSGVTEDPEREGPGGMEKSKGTQSSSQNIPSHGVGDFGNVWPTGEIPDFGNTGNFDGTMNKGQGAGTNTTSIMLLAVSVLCLAVGLIAAWKFRR